MCTFTEDVKELIEKRKSDVRRAFLGLDSPYVVRQEYLSHAKSPSDFFEDSPGKRKFNERVVVDPVMYKAVYKYRHQTPGSMSPSANKYNEHSADESSEEVSPSSVRKHLSFDMTPAPLLAKATHDTMKEICKDELQNVFTFKDLEALTKKAEELVKEKSIREGFEKNTFLVKSSSSATPHSVKHHATGHFVCDNACIGFKTRNICSHVMAVAFKGPLLA